MAFLERQLGLTESGLASCQRQLAEQSSAYCDLQSQVVQLRAAAQEGRQEVQELRGRLGRKEDQLGRVVGDRDALRKQLEDATRNLEEERREKEGREERMRIGGTTIQISGNICQSRHSPTVPARNRGDKIGCIVLQV